MNWKKARTIEFIVFLIGEKLLGRKTFLLNELLFCIAGIVVAVGMILCNGRFRKETGVWVGIITAVSVIYGTAFWGINRIVASVIGKRRQ